MLLSLAIALSTAAAAASSASGPYPVPAAWYDTEVHCTPEQRHAPKASSFGCYKGHSERLFTHFERTSIYVPARDGTRLAVDVYRPVADGRPVEGPLPVVFNYSRYWRAEQRADGSTMTYAGLMPKGVRMAEIASTIEAAPTKSPIVAQLLARGYVFVRAEARGTGASFGVRQGDMSGIEARDGADMVAWAAAQPWSNGRVAMIGGSYEGMSQFLVASQKPPALRAIFPQVAPFDEYRTSWAGAGVLRAYGLAWLAREARRDGVQKGTVGSVINPTVDNGPQVPPVDADPQGILRETAREERLKDPEAVDPLSYLTRQSPEFERFVRLVGDALGTHEPAEVIEVLYSPARLEALMRASPGLRDALTALHFYRDASPALVGPRADGPNSLAMLAPAIGSSGIAVYNWGGWRDFASVDTLLWDANLPGPRKLTMGPWSHGPNERGDKREAAARILQPIEQLRWLDYWLKGIDNGVMREQAVNFAIMNEGDDFSWASAPAWPPRKTRMQRLAFRKDGSLGAGSGPEQLSFTVDAETTLGNHTRYHDAIGLGPTRYPDLVEHAAKGLSFTTAPLARDLTVIGSPVIELALSSTTADAWPHAYLERVESDGSVQILADGVMRASHRVQGKSPYRNLGLPFSDSTRKIVDATPPLDPAKPAAILFDLQPIAARFPAGTRLRIVVTGAEAGTNMTVAQDPATRLTLHLGGEQGSAVYLPVAP